MKSSSFVVLLAAFIVATPQRNLGAEITSQILYQPRALGITAFVLLGFGIIPGLPLIPFWVSAALAGILTLLVHRATRQRENAEAEAASQEKANRQEEVIWYVGKM